MLKVGSRVPAFTVYDSEKQIITNETILGKSTLFLFFPAAFTSTCTKELCAVRDDLARYNALHVSVIGVSTDALFSLARYKEEQGLNFRLASDFNKEMSEAFGALYETFVYGMKGVSRRAAFIVDPQGIVQYAEVLESAGDLPDFNAIQARLEELSAIA
ncbi:MAG: peroxiredoxin [Bacteroidia bacterium]|nr:peroxiredoxin [Bacteroidia bacterium]